MITTYPHIITHNNYFISDTILSTEIDLTKTHVLGVDLSTFLPPLDDPSQSEHLPFNCTYRLTSVQAVGNQPVLALPMAITHPYNYENDQMYESSPDLAESGFRPSANLKHSQSMVFPEVGQKCDLDVVHQSRNRTFGIELDDFLPVRIGLLKVGWLKLDYTLGGGTRFILKERPEILN